MTHRRCLALLVLSSVCTVAPTAAARTTHDSPYTFPQTFGSAVRLVKVDMNLVITERDPEWGYFLFEYTSPESGNRKTRGAFEFVRRDGAVVVAVQLPAMPSYHERMIVDKLRRKLEEDYGPPVKPRKDKRRDDDRDDRDGRGDDGDGGDGEDTAPKQDR